MMNNKLIEKLEWNLLLNHLAQDCQTQEAKTRALSLQPTLKKGEIIEHWAKVEPLLAVVRLNLSPLIGDLSPVYALLKSLSIGQVLEGEQFKDILKLLETTQRVYDFAREYSVSCSTLFQVKNKLKPLPDLLRVLSRSIDDAGHIRDDATPELLRIRSQKRSLRKRIEETLSSISQGTEFSKYIQDDYFTLREDRYVIPVKLDGRGRVPGLIVDTSASGQTLFIEPSSIHSQNQMLKELELSERLETFRIMKELSQKIFHESSIIKSNYEEIIELDLLFAEARFAYSLDARTVPLSDRPLIQMKQALHPLIKLGGSRAVANDIELKEGQNALVISGPNAGGKTVILKTVGMIQMMVASGLLVPVGEGSEIYLFENMFIEMGDTQDLSSQLSTFSGHLMGLKPILQKAGKFDIVFLDEICVGTEPHTGAALAQSMLEHLVEKGVWVVATTHFDSLKVLAMNNSRFRSGAMGYREDYHPTYKLNVDIPGLSFGIEVAEQVGIAPTIIHRARDLHGKEASAFEDAIGAVLKKISNYETKLDEAEVKIRKAEEERSRWAHEVEVLKKRRHDLAEKVIDKYEQDLRDMREKFEETIKKLKPAHQDPLKKELSETLGDLQKGLVKLSDEHVVKEKEPGESVVFDKLRKGDSVYVTRFKKMGKLLRKGKTPDEKMEVEIGTLKFQVSLKELRLLPHSDIKKPNKLMQSKPGKAKKTTSSSQSEERRFVLPTATNTLDLRGVNLSDALEKTWKFMDAAVMRGEYAVIIIHGHGTQVLKNSIRRALQTESPYDITFHSGSPQEGGDGVTVVLFQKSTD